MKGSELEQWRDYFRTAKKDIFDIIKHAIMVAALDCPEEFRLRRDELAEKLFTIASTRCSDCDRVEFVLPDNVRVSQISFKRETDRANGGRKESKTNSSGADPLVNHFASSISYGEAEALTDELEEASMTVNEVLRIKDVLLNSQDVSDSALFDSLRRLQLMVLTIDILKVTEIGRVVNRFRKHSSKQIRHLAQTLIDGWKELVDEWVSVAEAIAAKNEFTEATPESMNPSVVDEELGEEEGLPSPPLDEGIFFATQPTSMELSQFFDGMDDDGNLRSSTECIKNHDSIRKPSQVNHNFPKRKQQTSSEANMVIKDDKSQQMKRVAPFAKPNNKPSNANTGIWRPTKYNMEQKLDTEWNMLQKSDRMGVIPKRPLSSEQDRFEASDDLSVQQKLEDAKRKLQERYQEAENAKRKRTIQVMELHDLPKQGSGNKKPFLKPGDRNRKPGNGRR